MGIFYIVGKPRGGKSYMGIKAICLELKDAQSDRFIVTNLPLKFDDYERIEFRLPTQKEKVLWYFLGWWRGKPRPKPERSVRIAKGLKTWCSENAPHVESLRERIRVLADDETGEFWLFEPGWEFTNRNKIKVNRRGTEIDVPDFTYEDGTKRGDTNSKNPGTLYVIDEIHLFFPARAWQRTGEDATFFLSQHGKLKADVIMITQHPEQCDRALRRLAQEYMSVRNLSREPIMGFRVGNFFRVNRMLNSPNSPNPYVFDSQFVGMNFREFGDLYDTSAGVGVAGSLVPNIEKRGRSLWWLALPVVAVLWLVFHPQYFTRPIRAATAYVTKSMMRAVNGQPSTTNQNESAAMPIGNRLFLPSNLPTPEKPAKSERIDQAQTDSTVRSLVTNTNEITCNGWSQTGRGFIVYLSNGESYDNTSGEVQEINKKYVKINGEKYRMAQIKSIPSIYIQNPQIPQTIGNKELPTERKTRAIFVPDIVEETP